MPRFWLPALLALAACAPKTERESQAVIDQALRQERPQQQLQQVRPLKVDGKTAFCGTAANIAERKPGHPVEHVEAFLFKDGRFFWARGPAADAALVKEQCEGLIYKGDILR